MTKGQYELDRQRKYRCPRTETAVPSNPTHLRISQWPRYYAGHAKYAMYLRGGDLNKNGSPISILIPENSENRFQKSSVNPAVGVGVRTVEHQVVRNVRFPSKVDIHERKRACPRQIGHQRLTTIGASSGIGCPLLGVTITRTVHMPGSPSVIPLISHDPSVCSMAFCSSA